MKTAEEEKVKDVCRWNMPCPYCKKYIQVKLVSPQSVKDEDFIEMKITKIEVVI